MSAGAPVDVQATVGALQDVLATLPGTGYRAVSASWDSPTPGVGLITLTVSVGQPADPEDDEAPPPADLPPRDRDYEHRTTV